MTRAVTYWVFLIIVCSTQMALAQEYHSYQMEKQFSVGIGKGEDQILFDWSDDGGPGPRSIVCDEQGFLYIGASQNKKFMKYTPEGKLLDQIKSHPSFTYSARVYWVENGFILYGTASYMIESAQGNLLVDVDLSSINHDEKISEIFHIKNYCFFRVNERNIISIPNPGPEIQENLKKVLNSEKTRALFREPGKYGLEGLAIDEQNRLFLNGELQTRDYRTYFLYQKKKYGDGYREKSEHQTKPPNERSQDVQYIGTDVNYNIYWRFIGKYICVFSLNGLVRDLFEIDMYKSKTAPVVHPSGDVFFLDYDEKNVAIYRIRNVWDPEAREKWEASLSPSTPTGPQYATSTESRVRVRAAANLHGQTLGHLEKGERVKVLEQSGQKMRVGEMEDYWYRVRRLSDGLTGWAYGYFLKRER